MSGPYCGIGTVPKNRVLGTAEECLAANQVRRYGRVLIDSKTQIKAVEKEEEKEEPQDNLIKLITYINVLLIYMLFMENEFDNTPIIKCI